MCPKAQSPRKSITSSLCCLYEDSKADQIKVTNRKCISSFWIDFLVITLVLYTDMTTEKLVILIEVKNEIGRFVHKITTHVEELYRCVQLFCSHKYAILTAVGG